MGFWSRFDLSGVSLERPETDRMAEGSERPPGWSGMVPMLLIKCSGLTNYSSTYKFGDGVRQSRKTDIWKFPYREIQREIRRRRAIFENLTFRVEP